MSGALFSDQFACKRKKTQASIVFYLQQIAF
jgi:hypothetical protein